MGSFVCNLNLHIAEHAILLNAQVVVAALVKARDNAEKAMLAPGFPPRISHDPVLDLGALLYAPAHNRNDMIDRWIRGILLVDAALIRVLQRRCRHNSARDGTVSVDLGHHLVAAPAGAEIAHLPLGIVGHLVAFAEFTARAALIKDVASLIESLVVVACLVWDAIVMRVLEDSAMIATVTGSSISAVEDILHGQIGRWPR